MGKEYTCAMCGGTFEEGWTEEEAMQEMQENFGDFDKPDCDVVCDDCYKKLMGDIPDTPIICDVPLSDEFKQFIDSHEEEFSKYFSQEFTRCFNEIVNDILLNGKNYNA